MRRRLARAAVGLGAMLLAAACGAGPGVLEGSAAPVSPDPQGVVTPWPGQSAAGLPADPAGTWWPVSSSTQLTPTGIELVAGSAVDAMVVDGVGAAWLHSVGKVTRVDPLTGSAQSWDLGDDAAFGTATGLRASRQSGVWLVSGEHLRLFDGHRFVRDIPVPAEFRGGDGVGITDMVEVGSEVWVSSAAGVARCAGGAWAMVGAGQLTHVRTLAAEPAGPVWAVGLASKGLSVHTTVARFDGHRWSSPQPSAPRSRGTVVAAPTGGVLRQLGVELHRFDGLAWRRLPDIPVRPGQLALPVAPAISPTGVVWLQGADFLAKQVSGRWRRVVDHESRDLVQMAFTDVDVLVADSTGLLRLEGDRLTRVWLDQDSRLGEPPVRLVALSSDEAWAISAHGTEPDAILRFSDGDWQGMAPGVNPVGLAVGTDAGVWVSTVEGLVRFSSGQWEAIDAGPQAGSLLAGPDGAVWVPQPASHSGCWSDGGASGAHQHFRQLVLVQPEGQRTTLRLPVGERPTTSIVTGTDGRVWTTTCRGGVEDGPTAPTLMRWDGTWSLVPYPGRSITGIAGGPLGGFWAWLTPDAAREDPLLAHYADGTWTEYPHVPDLISAAAAPGGSICGIESHGFALLCVDASGQITSTPVGVPAELSIGLDGSVWLTDPDRSGFVARLPDQVLR